MATLTLSSFIGRLNHLSLWSTNRWVGSSWSKFSQPFSPSLLLVASLNWRKTWKSWFCASNYPSCNASSTPPSSQNPIEDALGSPNQLGQTISHLSTNQPSLKRKLENGWLDLFKGQWNYKTFQQHYKRWKDVKDSVVMLFLSLNVLLNSDFGAWCHRE